MRRNKSSVYEGIEGQPSQEHGGVGDEQCVGTGAQAGVVDVLRLGMGACVWL